MAGRRSRGVTLVLWACQVVAAAAFVAAGGAKLAGAVPMVQMFDTIGIGQWFRYVTGSIEVASAVLLLVPRLAAFGAALLLCTMVGAIIAHLTVLHTSPAGPVVLLTMVSIVLWFRGSVIRAMLVRSS